MSIINFGSMNVDHTYSVPHILEPGETLQAAAYNIYAGGKGLNQTIAAARAGARIYHAGMIGKGGEMLRDFLNSSGADTRFVGEAEIPQGHAIIQVADRGENNIVVFRGSNFCITREYIDSVLDAAGDAEYVMLQNEISEVPYIIESAWKKGFKVVLNASPISETLNAIDIKMVAWLLVNEIEGAALTGETEPEKILEKLRQISPETGVVLTLGKAGSLCSKGGKTVKQGIFPVTAVDTTGAGDTFTGYFVAGMDAGLSMEETILRATAASAISVTRNGAAPSIPMMEEVKAFLRERS